MLSLGYRGKYDMGYIPEERGGGGGGGTAGFGHEGMGGSRKYT